MLLWAKWLHILAVISWMAGILYLYRLLVYRAENSEPGKRELLELMARRLYRFICTPAMIVTWIAGLALVVLFPSYWTGGKWLHAKFALVVALTGTTHVAGALLRKFEAGLPAASSRRLRLLNEVPTVLMCAIVYLVVFKPF